MKTTDITLPNGATTYHIPEDPATLTEIALANGVPLKDMQEVMDAMLRLNLTRCVVIGSLDDDGMIHATSVKYCASTMVQELGDVFSDADDNTLCPYKEWTGKPLPTSAEELIEEYERLCEPTYREYSDAKLAARDAVWDALERFRA
jgi:hypothetical protein